MQDSKFLHFFTKLIMNRILTISLILLSSITGFSQSHLWAESLSSSNSNTARGIAIDGNHNSFIVVEYRDTLKIKTKTFVSKSERRSSYTDDILLTKFNVQGTLTKYNNIYTKKTTGNSLLHFKDIKLLSNNRIMVYGYFYDCKILILSATDSITNNSNEGKGFIAIYDSSLNLSEYRVLYKASLSPSVLYLTATNQMDLDSKNNFYLNCIIGNGVFYSKRDSVKVSYSSTKSIVVKYSLNYDSIVWVKELSDKSTDNFIAMRMQVAKDDNLYLACNLLGGTQTINNKKYIFPNKFYKGLFIVLSPSGRFISSELINKDTTLQESLLDIGAADTNNIYVCGYAFDSIYFGNKWYKSANKYSAGTAYPYVGTVSTKKGAKWIDFATERDTVWGGFTLEWWSRLNFDKENNVYFSFFQHKQSNIVSIGGLKDSNTLNFYFSGFAKLDSMGNALWVRWIPVIYEIKPDSNNIVFTGAFNDSLKLKPLTIKSPWRGQCSFVAKTYDYAIRRGHVSTGPYCAGDTIIVPYTKDGEYDTSNFFIAELSDEFGRFDGKEQELGRLKTNKAGVVKGVLPLFQSASSGKYRIRIRSTNPVVQSNYKADGLRLLIYSKDKADPGKPESICYGDSIKLSTYGGTKWKWSPKYNMTDSLARQPVVWPIKTTTYKIIIGDSSGCGKPDTAFKLIRVRQPIKTVLAFTDTAVCGDGILRVPYYFTGGDSLNYKFQWYFISSPKLWFNLKKGQNVLKDTLDYFPSDPLEKLAIILTDGCTNMLDTAYLTITQRKPVVIKNTFRDSSLCAGHTLYYKATVTGGIPKYYNYQWKDLITNTILSESDSLKFITSKTLKIQLIVNDGCEALGDTAEFNVTVKPPLKASTNLRDTTICSGQKINYTATAHGGNTKAYKFYWVLNNKLVDTTSTLTLASTSTLTLTLILKDNCTIPNDTIKKTITIKPSPKADFTYDLACSRTITIFQFTGTKPSSPITTYFNWNFNTEATSTLENPSYKFAAAGTSTTTLILASDNGCTDTLTKTIEIKPQSKADFTTEDVCETDSAVFVNKSQDATGYNWKFGDGQTSKSQEPKHKFLISSTTTFNVTLVAVVTNGCSDSLTKALTVNSNPDSDFSFTTTGNKVDLRATVQGNTKYQWKFGTTDSATTSTGYYTHIIKSSDQYNVCLKVTNLAGCTSQTCKNVTVGITQLSISQRQIKIYPNPNDGNFSIEIENPGKDVSIEVYDMMGRMVKMVKMVEKVIGLDLGVEEGIYFVRVNNGKEAWNANFFVSYSADNKR